jgi:hypothetical protein
MPRCVTAFTIRERRGREQMSHAGATQDNEGVEVLRLYPFIVRRADGLRIELRASFAQSFLFFSIFKPRGSLD